MTKLVQLNAWGGRLEGVLRDYLKQESPDILCLQEAISYDRDNSAFFVTIEQMQKICGLPFAAFGLVFSFRLMNSNASFGNCILSKYPLQKSEVVFTRLEHQEYFDFNEHDYNARNFVHAQIEIDNKKHHIITHHGHHVHEHKNGNDETMRQMKLLTEYIKQLDGPVILTGDFNLAPHSESLKDLNGLLTNLPVSHKLKTTRTPLTHKTEVCDYVFINEKVKVHKFAASDEMISDHKALIVDF